jgi:hypothetical protein
VIDNIFWGNNEGNYVFERDLTHNWAVPWKA